MINSSEMSLGFHDASLQRAQIRPIKIAPSVSKLSSFKQYIYSWMALEELIKALKKQPRDTFDPENDRLERFSIRFVVDKIGNSWFALEGEISTATPAHSQMVGENAVLAAGNLVLSEDYTTIIEITNKSGHYLPEFKTLVFFIKTLFALETDPRFSLMIAPEIKIVRYAQQSRFTPDPVSHITLSKEALRSLLPIDFAPKIPPYPFAKLRKAEDEQIVFDSSEDYFSHKASQQHERHSFPGCSFSMMHKPRKINLGKMPAQTSSQLANFGLFETTALVSGKRSHDVSAKDHAPTPVLGDHLSNMTHLFPLNQTQGQARSFHGATVFGSAGDTKKIKLYSEQQDRENTAPVVTELVR